MKCNWRTVRRLLGGAICVFSLVTVSYAGITQIRIGNQNDDAEEHLDDNRMDLGSSDLEFGEEGAGDFQEVGLRFAGVPIDQGTDIDTSFIQFWTDEEDSVATSLRIFGELTLDSAQFTSAASNISDRIKTTSFVDWNDIPAWDVVGAGGADQRTPDLTPILTEIFAQPGWTYGNALSIIVVPSPGGERTAESFSGGPDLSPLLTITGANVPDADLPLPPGEIILPPPPGLMQVSGNVLFREDFERVNLRTVVDEGGEGDVWTKQAPAGWGIDDTNMFNNGVVGGRVTEWDGWSFANKDWWIGAAGNQDRIQYELGVGNVAIADPDEWDDLGDPDSGGTFNSLLTTPPISLEGVLPGTLEIEFDSSWKNEEPQQATLDVSFDGGPMQKIFLWDTQDGASPDFKETATNEHVLFSLNNPEGASEVVIQFGMINARNDWWWAIDNIQVNGSKVFNLNGGGETYVENFDAMGVEPGAFTPSGWTAEDNDGSTNRASAMGLNDGPASVGDSIVGVNNVGGNAQRFGSADGNAVATWKDDLDGNSAFGEGDVVADAAEDRALGVFREEGDVGKLNLEVNIGSNPLRAFTLDWDLEIWGGDPESDFRGSDGGGFNVELTIGDTSYYSATELLKPGEKFDTTFDTFNNDVNDPTLIDGNVYSRRDIGPDGIIEVTGADGAVGNVIKLSFDANVTPDSFGWTPAVDNVRLRALAPGDADANGVVDVADLLQLLGGQKFNKGVDGVTWAQGDFNADDQFNTGDLLAMLSFLSGTFPSDPYASEAGGASDAVADIIVNSETGEVTVDLAGHTVSAIIIESASEIFNGQQPEWDTTSQFPSTLPGELGNVLFTSTASGVDELGAVISAEFLGRDKEFYLQDLDLNILIASEGGALTKGNVIVVPEPSTWMLLGLGSLAIVGVIRRRMA